jgi:hypothetical protein
MGSRHKLSIRAVAQPPNSKKIYTKGKKSFENFGSALSSRVENGARGEIYLCASAARVAKILFGATPTSRKFF